jgi:hypothetical protein
MPARPPITKPSRLAVLLMLAVLGTGCGAQEPQPPAVQANRIASALTGITEACAEHQQELTLPRFGSPSRGPLEAAHMRAVELARVFTENPDWVYQGQTLREVVAGTISYLRECHLPGSHFTMR